MIVYRILRSDQAKMDYIKTPENDFDKAKTALAAYLQPIDNQYQLTADTLAVWVMHDNASKNYKNIIRFESAQNAEIIIQVKRN